MRYIIMCGGEYGWAKPRQMTEIFGEAVVARTIRLLRQEGVQEIVISATDRRFGRFGVPVISHENDFKVEKGEVVRGSWANAFYPTEDPACYIFGDVVFSQEAIRKIVQAPEAGILFFGSTPPFSPLYIKQYAEPFAFKVVDQYHLHKAVDRVKELDRMGAFQRKPIAWELWSVIRGTNPNRVNKHYVAINDYTCDIDNPEDVEKVRGAMDE